jgi:hypothetical protein
LTNTRKLTGRFIAYEVTRTPMNMTDKLGSTPLADEKKHVDGTDDKVTEPIFIKLLYVMDLDMVN